MWKVLNKEQMQRADAYTIEEIGVPSAVLMERAALAAACEVRKLLGESKSRDVLVLAGTGNNGGDGFACARILYMDGIQASVILTGNPSHLTEEASRQMRICENIGIPISILSLMPPDDQHALIAGAGVIVDAVFGIRLTRPVTGLISELFEEVNSSGAKVAAVDIPSGVLSDTGAVLGTAVKADVTVTMQCAKPGLLLYPGAFYAGKVTVAEIGVILPDSGSMLSPDTSDLKTMLPHRNPSGNKGTFGKVLLIAGSKNMAGAACLAGMAALRSGCGMVKILTSEENRIIIQSVLPEAMLGTFESEEEAIEELRKGLAWCDAVGCGPGFGTDDIRKKLLQTLLAECAKPLVLDADALNLIGADSSLLKARITGCSVYVTPHLGEMARLTGLPVSEIKKNPIAAARDYAASNNLTCVLKDARTVTAAPDGSIFLNRNGNSGMATAGSGDTLTGILTSLLGQGTDPALAAPCAVCLHGAAGDAARDRLGERSLTAGDIADAIPGVFCTLNNSRQK